MKTVWSNLCGHCSVAVVLGALAAAGMDWSGENVGALRGAAWIGGWWAAAVANVRSADIVSAASVAISPRKEAASVAVGGLCHGSAAMGDQVRGVMDEADRGGGGRTARIADGIQYITPETKFYHCAGCFDSGTSALNGRPSLPFPCFRDQKKKKGGRA